LVSRLKEERQGTGVGEDVTAGWREFFCSLPNIITLLKSKERTRTFAEMEKEYYILFRLL